MGVEGEGERTAKMGNGEGADRLDDQNRRARAASLCGQH